MGFFLLRVLTRTLPTPPPQINEGATSALWLTLGSSGDSIEPVRSQVSEYPPGMVDVYRGSLPQPFADGPARWLSFVVI